MKWSILLALALALPLLGCATQPAPPPESAPPPEPAAAPAAQPEQPQTPPTHDPSKPPPEVEAGCLPECTMVAGKCQALVHPGPVNDEQEAEEIGRGPKPAEKMVKPCAAHCCRGQD